MPDENNPLTSIRPKEDNQTIPVQPEVSTGSSKVIQPSSEFIQTQQQIEQHPQPGVQTDSTSVPQVLERSGVVVGDETYQPTTPMSSSQLAGLADSKPSKWRFFFIILGVLQALGVAIFFLIMMWAGQQAKAGVSGTEFIALYLFITLVPVVGIIALINLVCLPIYMRKHGPHGKGLVFCIMSVSISVILALYGAYSVYQLRVAAPKHINELSQQINQDMEVREQKFATDNAKPEITKDEAVVLLKSCQLKGFYYTNQTSPKADGNWAESSSTGVVLTKIDGQPYRISIADRLTPELVPIAREAQKTCGGQPQFWHDGSYE